MALIVKIAQFLTRLNEAFVESQSARQAARRKYPYIPEE